MHPPRLCDRDRGGSDVHREEPSELPFTDADPLRERRDVCVIERAIFDEPERARDRARCSTPRAEIRRCLRPTAKAGTKPCFLRSGRGRKEDDVLPLRTARGTNGTAIDAGRLHAREEATVEARITSAD